MDKHPRTVRTVVADQLTEAPVKGDATQVELCRGYGGCVCAGAEARQVRAPGT